MILDSSVVLAILKKEPEAARFAVMIESAELLRISAANYFESSIVVDRMRNPGLSSSLDEMLERAKVIVEPVTAEQASIARQAYRDLRQGERASGGVELWELL